MGGGTSFPVISLPRERIVIVTGGNTGLGYEISKWIAFMGATVILACRSKERAEHAISKIQDEYDKDKQKLSAEHGIPEKESLALEFMELDLSSFQSTLNFSDQYCKTSRKLHVLICNAGIAMTPYEKTEDGYERMLQVNYLSHFLLVAKLLPVMRNSGDDCRLLMMSSDAHRACSFKAETINYSGDPSRFKRLDYYGRSKLYQIMQMHCMVRRLAGSNISVNTSHPGLVETEIARNFPDLIFWNTVLVKASKITGTMKTPFEGAKSIINAAVNPALKGIGGRYYINCKDGYTTGDARNVEKQELLWQKTLEYLKEYITEEERACLEGK